MDEFLLQCEDEVGRLLTPDEHRMAVFFYNDYLKAKKDDRAEVLCSVGLEGPASEGKRIYAVPIRAEAHGQGSLIIKGFSLSEFVDGEVDVIVMKRAD